MNKTETRILIKALEPDVDLWRIAGTDDFVMCFHLGGGQVFSHQTDDIRYLAQMLFQTGHFADLSTAVKAIKQ